MENEKRYIGIGKVAWGYFFVYIDFKINSVSLLPAFVGYLLFLSAIHYLQEDERELTLLKPLGVILALWYGVNWLVSFGGVGLGGLWQVADILIAMVNLYFHFQLLTNVASIAKKHQPEGYSLDAELLRYRTVLTVLQTVFIVIGLLSKWFGDFAVLVSVLGLVVHLVVVIAVMKVLFELRRCFGEAENIG